MSEEPNHLVAEHLARELGVMGGIQVGVNGGESPVARSVRNIEMWTSNVHVQVDGLYERLGAVLAVPAETAVPGTAAEQSNGFVAVAHAQSSPLVRELDECAYQIARLSERVAMLCSSLDVGVDPAAKAEKAPAY